MWFDSTVVHCWKDAGNFSGGSSFLFLFTSLVRSNSQMPIQAPSLTHFLLVTGHSFNFVLQYSPNVLIFINSFFFKCRDSRDFAELSSFSV